MSDRQSFENWYIQNSTCGGGVGTRDCALQWEAWQAARAAPSPETPEAEGAEPMHQDWCASLYSDRMNEEGTKTFQRPCNCGASPPAAHPGPGIIEAQAFHDSFRAAAQEQKPGLFPPTVNDYHVSAFLFAGLDEITAINVGRFAKSLANKLLAAKAKYGYTDGWAQGGWEDECRAALLHHIEKGDPLDVAAFAMFMWKHEWSTASPIPASGWVKCSDEDFESYPESEKMVLVSIGNSVRLGYKQVCRHPWNKRWKIFGYGTDRSDSVDHWMLLPVAPSETK